MCTDNPILLKNTRNDPTIICLQKTAAKKIVDEEDIIIANKLAFNDEIGIITNHVTAMFDVQAGFDKESDEYKTLQYRIMCGQHYQQCAIDRAKGIIAKSMPNYWYSMRDNKIKEEDEDIKGMVEKKLFNQRIVAYRKPYFMTYVYPRLKTENDTYIKNNERTARWRYAHKGIKNIQELFNSNEEEFKLYVDYYNKLLPVNNNKCTVNRISWLFERKFKEYSLNKKQSNFDYSILKSDTEYSNKDYVKILNIYKEYIKKVEQFQQKARTEKLDKDACWIEKNKFVEYFKSECEKICPNEKELCNIVIDICYCSEKSKQFAWDICGNVIVNNLLEKNKYTIHYPQLTDGQEDFIYCGKKFIMATKQMEVDSELLY